MKEAKLIEMQKRIEILGNAVNRVLFELDQIKTLSVGNMELVKLLPGYQDALAQLKEQHEDTKDKKLDLDGQE